MPVGQRRSRVFLWYTLYMKKREKDQDNDQDAGRDSPENHDPERKDSERNALERKKQLERHRMYFRTVLVLVLFTIIGLVASVSYHLSGGNPQTLPIEQTLRSLFRLP